MPDFWLSALPIDNLFYASVTISLPLEGGGNPSEPCVSDAVDGRS